MARTANYLTPAEIAIIQSLEPIGTARQEIKVNEGETALVYFSPTLANTYAPGSWAQGVAIDCATSNIHEVTGNAAWTAITFTVSWAINSQVFIVSILQGAVVSTISGWFATVRWAWGVTPTLTAVAGKRDTFAFKRTWANTYDWFIVWQNC